MSDTEYAGWMSVRDAARYTRLPERSIRKYFEAGVLKAAKLGRAWRTTKEWLDKSLEENLP